MGAMTNGKVGDETPALGKTVLAWWNEYRYKRNNDALERETRTTDNSILGQVLHIHLYGFRFNPRADQRFWNIFQLYHYLQGLDTQPHMYIAVARAEGISDNFRIQMDGTADGDGSTSFSSSSIPSSGPFVCALDYNRGRPRIHNSDEYPSSAKTLGSKVVVTLEITKAQRDTGPQGLGQTLQGSIEYKREKADGDPSGAQTGSMEVTFSAEVISERLAECNFGNGEDMDAADPCEDMEGDGEAMLP
jgi:hypothetical protein